VTGSAAMQKECIIAFLRQCFKFWLHCGCSIFCI